jgi:tetratricopeptide (TPR) repeat protein
LRRIATDVDELARARRVAELGVAAALPDRRAERRRRVAEPDLDFREFCRHSKLPQSERSWDLFAAERYRRGETSIPSYESAGDLGRAIPLLEQALADRQRVLGADHPQTLTSRNNLAYAYQSAGDLGRAIPLYEQALADTVRVLGADHPTTKIVRDNLAAARQHSK